MLNPDHVGHGVGDFVVQALSRQGCIENKKHPRQRRPGGRERMKSESRTLRGLALLAGISGAVILTAGLAHAEDAAHPCDVPAYLLTSESSLPKVADVVKSGQPLTILVVGSRSSPITGSGGSAYPPRLQAALKEKLPQVPINLSVELQTSKTAEDAVGSLDKLVEAKKPTL